MTAFSGFDQAREFIAGVFRASMQYFRHDLLYRLYGSGSIGAVLRAGLDGTVLSQFAGRVLPLDQAVALRCARLHVPDPRAKSVTAYQQEFGAPAYNELASRPMLYYSLAPLREITVHGPHGEENVTLTSGFQSSNESVLHLAALQGMGYALLPDRLVGGDIDSGRLVVLLPDYPARVIPLLGVYPNRKYLSSKVRTFLEFMIQAEAAGA